MNSHITLPLWLVAAGSFFALWALLNRLLVPGVRWFFRRRANLVIKEINKRLDVKLPDFKLSKRRELIDRLKYDSEVFQAIKEYVRENGVPNEVAREKVERYAREIVPAFNAFVYFRIGSWLCKKISRLLFRIRVGFTDEEGLKKINPNSSIVFIMNHRSNLDYILLGYLAIHRVAMSFAVGEWARVWPVQQLIRSMGAYFVRRGSKNTLYRRVLSRYVQMATEAGVVQAVFPEGKLSLDGGLNPPRIGLLDYMLRGFDPAGDRDLVFIPAGINYDRVLEDRSQLTRGNRSAPKKSRVDVIKAAGGFILRNVWLMLRGRWYRFGYAVVNFGTPVSMREYEKNSKIVLKDLDKHSRIEKVQRFADDLMESVSHIIPVVPVALISRVFAENPEKTLTELELKAHVQILIDDLERRAAVVYIPRQDRDYAIEVGLRMLTLRHLVREEDNLYRADPTELDLLRYYANSIAHFFRETIPRKPGQA